MAATRLLMDSVPVRSPGGERLQIELAAALDRTCPPDGEAIVIHRADQTAIQGFSHIQSCSVPVRPTAALGKLHWLTIGLSRCVKRFDATAVFCAGGIVLRRVSRTLGWIVSTNNMLPFSPEMIRQFPTLAPSRLRLRLNRFLTVRSLRVANEVVLHSQHALDTVGAYAPGLAEKTTVVLSGIPRDTRLEDPPPAHPYSGRPYFLYFSSIHRYKNHLALIEAYRQLSRVQPDLPDLLIAGMCKERDYLAAIQSAIDEASLKDRIRYLGEVPRRAVPAWLHHATVNVFPSLCETGSVIQAEIIGLQGVLATSSIPPMPELAGPAAVLFDPRDPTDIARVMGDLWRAPEMREELRHKAAQRVQHLSWDNCGRAIWQAAERVTRSAEKRGPLMGTWQRGA